jgi:chromosome segregation ATPase
MRRFVTPFVFALFLSGGILLSGCSSSASDEELRQLQALKDEVAALDRTVNDKKATISDLDRQIADKNAKLKQCQEDQQEAKKALGK